MKGGDDMEEGERDRDGASKRKERHKYPPNPTYMGMITYLHLYKIAYQYV